VSRYELGQRPGAFGYERVGDLWRPYGRSCLQFSSGLRYVTGAGRIEVRVPAGFVYDGASVPNWAWPMLVTVGPIELLLPGAVHDLPYRTDGLAFDRQTGREVRLTREEADDIIREAAMARGAHGADPGVIRYAVGVAGWASWEKKGVLWRPAGAA
jgi:hypothetical protein